ncbi:MAG: flavin reductase family protein [Phycisphaerae bacterium]
MGKCAFPIDKRAWSPSVIPGPIVLISTVDADGVANVAPKSWVQMVAFEPPTLMFSGTKGNATEENILATDGFAVNIVDEQLLPSVVGCLAWRGVERIERSGWRLEPARRIRAPLVAQAPAQLECSLVKTVSVGSGFVVFGRIIAARIDEAIGGAAGDERYDLLRQACFLEDGVYGIIRVTRRV